MAEVQVPTAANVSVKVARVAGEMDVVKPIHFAPRSDLVAVAAE